MEVNWKTAFDAFDTDEDGVIQPEVLMELLQAISLNPTEEEVEDMIEDIGQEKIDYEIFEYIAKKHSKGARPFDELMRVFRCFDTENTGLLPIQTIRDVLGKKHNPFTHKQIEAIVDKIPEQEGGLIQYEEVVKKLLKI